MPEDLKALALRHLDEETGDWTVMAGAMRRMRPLAGCCRAVVRRERVAVLEARMVKRRDEGADIVLDGSDWIWQRRSQWYCICCVVVEESYDEA